MIGVRPPAGVYTHIIGVDIVRTGENDFFVLEDNARTPSGVSYMLENRETMMQLFPELFQKIKVRPVENYPALLRRSLAAVKPESANGQPTIAVLTPGSYNSAYFEHAFLADQMGVQLVEGAEGRAGEEAELGVVPLALELGDHHDRQHDLVLREALDRPRIGEEDARVEDVGETVGRCAGRCGAG